MPGKENGVANGRDRSFANFDPDDPEYIRDLQRPAAIKARERAYRTAQMGGGGVLRSPNKDDPGKAINWRVGELEWEAWMRVLDNAGFRTGHMYRQPFLRSKTIAPTAVQSDVAVPPSASSVGAVDETDAEAVAAHRVALLRREQERSRWLNSPNAYQKVEMLETGTDHPKVITKWVQDATSPSHGTPVKINSPHQFSPFGMNPKEFKDKQKAIKENRRLGTTSAGPQSQILDGVTYEEMAQMRDAEMSGLLPQDRVVMIGTASKGIIDREYQHNAQVYRQLYAPNPFASETDEDIQKYMKEIESKTPRPASSAHTTLDDTRGTASPPPYETESPSAETVSLMQAAREHRSKNGRKGLQNASASIEEVPDDNQADMAIVTSSGAKGIHNLTRETTFDEQNRTTTRMVEKPSAARESDVRKPEGKAASDDELEGAKDGKKKKKRSFFSFGKKKK
uniref:Uncharacterized protein n=1 Tax=Plectus sambesii TaxID=2011161 RepID=A0A914VJZ3_9BILA